MTPPSGGSRQRPIHISSSTRQLTRKSSFTRCATARAILPTMYDQSELSRNHRGDRNVCPARRRISCCIIAPRRSSSAHLHRPCRAPHHEDWKERGNENADRRKGHVVDVDGH